MTAKKTTISIKSLDARAASEVPFKFEFIDALGNETGVILHVLGGQSDAVTRKVNAMMNERRRAAATKEVAQKTGGRKPVEFDTVEDDIEFGQRIAAVRLVGWDGLDEPYTPELALELIRSNLDIANQVSEKSSDMANFMKSSSPS
jgi:hypothetical protein